MKFSTSHFTVCRAWTLRTAAGISAVLAGLKTFVLTTPTLDALKASDALAKSQQGLQMMWYGMSAIGWTYPILLLFLSRMPSSPARALLGVVGSYNIAQAVFYLATALWIDGPSHLILTLCALHAAAGTLALFARPGRQADAALLPRRRGYRLVLFCVAVAITTPNAFYHTLFATFYGWPAQLLASNTPSPSKQTLYAMWLFSCVLFASVPAALVWSVWAPAAAGRAVLNYLAFVIGALMVSWACALALGIGPELPLSGPISLAVIAAMTALSAPQTPSWQNGPRPRLTA